MAATLDEETCASLSLLLKAKSKDFVKNIIQDGYQYRTVAVPTSIIKATASSLDVGFDEAEMLTASVVKMVKLALYEGITDAKDMFVMFPDTFHKNLRELLAKLIAENMPSWHASSIHDQVSLPRLVDFDWRVDVKTSSDAITRMSIPTCIMQLQVEETASHGGSMPTVRCLNVELTKEKLDTMLDGLGKIRDQLSSVAK